MRYRLADIALRTSLVYAFAGAVWILLSDWLLEIVIKDPASISRIQTYKGWMFIAITTALLYATLRRELQRQKQESLKREQADAELREHQRKLDTLLDLLPVGITILDADRKVLFANSAQKAIADLRAPTFAHQAKPPARFLNAMGEPVPLDSVTSARALREHRTILNEETGMVYDDGGVRWMNVSAVPVDFPDWKVVTVSTDITQRKRAEQALEAERRLLAQRVAERTADLRLANAELARAVRLKDDFLANMSHELRTPLNAILNRSEALQEEIYGPVLPKQVEMLRSIEESGQHLLTLINDILDLSKIEAGRLTLEQQSVDVAMLCQMSIRMVSQIAISKGIDLTSSIDPLIETIGADERRLKQILVNLLSNAVKFTPAGGKVGLEVRGEPDQERMTFTVWDTGIGIAAEDLPKLFQPFVQVDSSLSRQYEGTGLGLALVRRLAEAHGGSVTLASTPGQGSRFSVALPWDPAEQLSAGDKALAERGAVAEAAKFALVIADAASPAKQTVRYLRELGARAELVTCMSNALEQASALQPDVVVLDITATGGEGWEMLRQLKAQPQTQALPVIVVSAAPAPVQARDLGAAGVLLKPLDRAMFVAALRSVSARAIEVPTRLDPASAAQAARPRVLVAEDNQANIGALLDYLSSKGYDVSVAHDGHSALAHAQADQPDIILMDIQMPGMDGLDVIRHIRADRLLAATPIIAVTALAMPGDRERCIAAGADDYLSKPIHLRTLVTMMEALRERRSQAKG